MAGWYEKLGVRPFINCSGPSTAIGGSLMAPEVLEAMADASKRSVFLDELQEKAGSYIAELVGVEATFVAAGAADGLLLACAACIAGADPRKIARLPDTTGMKNEIVMHKVHRSDWDQAFLGVGARIVEIGVGDRTYAWQLEEAITDKTAGVFYAAGHHEGITRPFPEVADVAHSKGVPVFVDFAGAVPPPENLHKYTDLGADLVIISGGKGIRGPQASGLILGRKDLIKACQGNANPHHSIGRPAKVGKEEIVGLVAAVELYLNRISKEEMAYFDQVMDYLGKALSGIPNISTCVGFSHRPPTVVPHLTIELGRGFPKATEVLAKELLAGEPSILVGRGQCHISISPHCVPVGSEKIVAKRLREVLTS